jgi:uncharacterized NAD(P)/FAD-binding protein YdhS
MRSDAARTVAVIGGGFSGTMTAVQLARRGVAVQLFERSPEVGRGVAYGTRDAGHLLNVPAAKMSAFADQPDHFRSALALDAGAFAPRHAYGAYLQAILDAHPSVRVEQRDVRRIERANGKWRLEFGDGGTCAAAAVVLALGNEPPALPPGWEALPIIANPWSEEARAAIARLADEEGNVLLIGTGLTMIDVALSLDDAGFRGRSLAVSRRGLLPRSHEAHEAAPVTQAELPQGKVLALWRWLRRRSAEVGFRAAVDSLRPHSAAIWQGWPLEERRRFLRHARPWWDVHRHRIAPQIGRRLHELVAAGRLEVAAARLARKDRQGLILAGRNGERRVSPRLLVNCTGPLGDVRRSANSLLRSLLEDGLVTADPLGLGLTVDARDRAGVDLWAIGPLTKGMYWEMTAVPDIRTQAERIAVDILKELTPHG